MMPDFTLNRYPLVSCICVTKGRLELLALAVEDFHRQDYPWKELIVVTDGGEHPGHDHHPDVRQIVYPGYRSVGFKRNKGIQAARGEIVAMWDDDDWFGPDRIRAQVEPIVHGRARLTILELDYVVWLPEGAFRRFKSGSPLKGNIAFADQTMVMDGALYREYGPLDDLDVVENQKFLRDIQDAGVATEFVGNLKRFMYTRHPLASLPYEKDNPIHFESATRPDWFDVLTLDRYVRAAKADAERASEVTA